MKKNNKKRNQDKIVKSRKIEVLPVLSITASDFDNTKEFEEKRKEELDIIYSKIRKWQKETAIASNKAISDLYHYNSIVRYDYLKEGVKEKLRIQLNNKENGALVKSFQNISYSSIKESSPNLNSYIRTSMADKVFKLFKNTLFDVKIGKISVPSYKNTQPIPFTKKAIGNIRVCNKDIVFDFIDGIKFKFNFGRDKSNNESIIKRIISGEYSLCDSSFFYEDKKIFFNIAFSFDKTKVELNKDIVIGVDCGINVPAVAVVLKNNEKIDQLFIGSRNTFLDARTSIFNTKRRITSSCKYAKSGRGRKRKLKASDRIGERERNFVKNQNHIFSKAVIELALKYGAATIKLENLSGIGKDRRNNYLLRNWSYYELQTFIVSKAKEVGIDVIFIDPANTSRTCPECGCISKENRKTQQEFICIECNYSDNADITAAINIGRANKLKEKNENEVLTLV